VAVVPWIATALNHYQQKLKKGTVAMIVHLLGNMRFKNAQKLYRSKRFYDWLLLL